MGNAATSPPCTGANWMQERGTSLKIAIFLGAACRRSRPERRPRASCDPADRPRPAATRGMRHGQTGAPLLTSVAEHWPPARMPGHGHCRSCIRTGHATPCSRAGAPAACAPGRIPHPAGGRLRRCVAAGPRSRLALPVARPARRACRGIIVPLRQCPSYAPAQMRLDAPKAAPLARTREVEPA